MIEGIREIGTIEIANIINVQHQCIFNLVKYTSAM